mgnify:CR=1 FL=1
MLNKFSFALSRGILVPTMETHECLVAGQLYSSIPIANIRAGWQNTHVTVTDHTGIAMHIVYNESIFGST